MIIKPILTEKTLSLAEKLNQYTFQVSMDANKVEAAKDLALKFKVTVKSVRVINRLGESFTYGKNSRRTGKHSDSKVMIFKLKEGDKIDAFIQ